MANQRILRGVAATLTTTFVDQNGTAADAAGTVTVTVTRADGTVILPALTSTTHGATGVYTAALTAAQTATLDLLTAVWADTAVTRQTTLHEVVGGYYFSIADARASDSTLTDATKYPDATILTTRQEVEEECEAICDVAFVPRYRRIRLDGSGTGELILLDNRIRTIRSIRTYSDATTYTAFTAAELAAIQTTNDGAPGDTLIQRTDSGLFTEGLRNVVVEYEYGYDTPPSDLRRASLRRLRNRLNQPFNAINDRATSLQLAEGGTIQLDTPGAWKTGVPEIDAVYDRYSLRDRGDRPPQPASRTLSYDPQWSSVFHGGHR